jgi:multiple sugar transport system permease protein
MAMSIPQDETASVKRAPKQVRTLPDSWLCGLFLAPSGLILALMVFYPFFSLIYYSTLRFSMMRPRIEPVDVGLGNYVDLLTDNEIWQRFAFTGKFVLATVLIQFTIGLAVAYAFQRNFKGRDFLFTLALLPMMLCPIVVGFLWRYMFNSEWGVVNWLVSLVGIAKIDWLGRSENALWAVAVADAWTWTPFVILLATAAFRGIPKDIKESAEIDGASPMFTFFRVTLPMSLPILMIALLLRLIDAFKQYDLFLAMTGGGPASETQTAAFALGKIAFGYFHTGEASALAIILLIVIMGLSMIFVRYLTRLSNRV